MLNMLNSKLLIAILAVLAAIASTEVYRAHEAHRAAEAATKTAKILQQQQREADEQRKRDEAFRQRIEQDRKNHSFAAANEGKTWKTYIP